MLGVFNSSENSKVALGALGTFIVIFLVNFAFLMNQIGDIPTDVQLWDGFWASLLEALAIYCINKGIQWRRKEA